tara:strand:- start:33107 stop:33382 length:276 start_codon:yes stop_codon:yes gene_type:complete
MSDKMKFEKDLGYEIELRLAVWDVMNHEERMEFMERQLDATFEEKQRLENVIEEQRSELIKRREDIKRLIDEPELASTLYYQSLPYLQGRR